MLPLEMARNRIAAGIGDAADHAIVAAASVPQSSAQPTSLLANRLSIRDMILRKPDPIDMVLDGLPLGSLGVVLGPGGVGKSIAMLHILYAIGIGTDTLGCLLPATRVTPYGHVGYLPGEDDPLVMHHRTHAFWARVPEDILAAMDERIHIAPLVGTAPMLMDKDGNLDDAALAQLRVTARGLRALIIDPMRQFHGGDENDNGMMTVLSKALVQIAYEERCTIILVHHVSKSGAQAEEADAHIARGAAAITDNARWVLTLRKFSAKAIEDFGLAGPAWRYVSMQKAKANYAALGDATLLVRGDGGILSPATTMPKSTLDRVMQSIRGKVEDDDRYRPMTAADLLAMGDDDAA